MASASCSLLGNAPSACKTKNTHELPHLSVSLPHFVYHPPHSRTIAAAAAGDQVYPNGLEFIRHKKMLSELSTWGIGGPCNYFIQVTSRSQLISALRYCHDHSIKFLIVGKGSNCLFDDRGFDGCVILNQIEFVEKTEQGIYRVGSGYPFNRLGVQCCIEGFSGLEFAGGIPGTVGGAVYMNAGANGQETANVIDSIEVVTPDGRHIILDRKDLNFSYRRSSFQDMEDFSAIIAVTFRLTPSMSARERQKAFLARRRSTQPVGECSAGSVFRNPPGFSAGKLIEKVGLKGFRLGGAKVSEVHANFFINSGSSTSRDMLELIHLAKEKVNSEFGIQLKEESRLSDAATAALKDLLPAYAENDLGSVCSWADRVKFRYHWSSALHYIDTPDNLCTYQYARDCKDETGEKDRCVAGAVNNYTSQLLTYKDSSSQYNLTEALLFLSHFIGDIHQPLHVGFTTDRGANTIEVHWYKRKENLHHVWDANIIETAEERFYETDINEFIDAIQQNITGAWADQVQGWETCSRSKTACPDIYATEGIKAACQWAYKGVRNDSTLEDDYFLSRLPVVNLRLAQGGVRLAATLNRIFG